MKRGQSVKLILTDTVHGGLCLEMPSEHLIFLEQPCDIVITKPAVVWIIMFFCCLFEKMDNAVQLRWRPQGDTVHMEVRIQGVQWRLTISLRYFMWKKSRI